MQRVTDYACHTLMKYTALLFIIGCCLSCQKTRYETITGTVVGQGGASAASWQVEIDDASSKRYSFLCHDLPGTMTPVYSCHNAIFITNLPKSLQIAGLKIQFSRYTDKGVNPIWSYSYASHDVEVSDASRNE